MTPRKFVFVYALLANSFLTVSKTQAETLPYQPLADIKLHPQRSAPATAMSLNDSIVSSQLTATVDNVKARVSQHVKRGELLVELDCTDYLLARDRASALLDSANASATLAKSQLSRAKDLLDKSLGSQQQYDMRKAESLAAIANVKQHRVQLQQAKVSVDRCKIKAPFSGIVTERHVAKGQLASAGMPLVSLVDTEQLELSANISANDYQHFDNTVAFSFDFGESVNVSLYNSGGVIDSQTRNIEARFQFLDEKPMPGTSGKLRWQDPRSFVPARYVVSRGKEIGVFVYDKANQRVEFKSVPNAAVGRPVSVDFAPSTLIFTQNLGTLNHGDSLN